MKNLFIVILISCVFWSCEKTVLLDLNQNVPRIVIEGQVTNQPGYQYVKITRTSGFYQAGESPDVEDAIVRVTDDMGNEFIFIHNPGKLADSTGYYRPEIPFKGEIGRTYRLSVSADGEIYEAEDNMKPVTVIDSLTSRISTDEQDDPKDFGRFYEVLMYAKEPQNTIDYYLFKFYRNDSLKVYDDTDIYYADDEVLGENIDGVPSPIYYAPGDIARVEMYSITRNGYVFYNDLQSLLNSDGGLFSQPPSNSRSNLSNGALGFFQASALQIKELVIKE
ncbi:MAG: hypothetical protein C0490_06110 [Marivirga sp.]|nr:hypothetical protein [Marivirga sp.]